jgi:EAL domain-containing protein (putative c-di-GMP-specific phosphodiesterase class I)
LGHGDRIVQKAVEAMRAKGLRVALDDFGTGHASLTHLLTVPVDIIKIDKSFIDRLAPGDASEAIVEGLIGIAGKLNIRVVAEGIETEAQATHLQLLGCKLGQGYLFSHAVDKRATTSLLMDQAQPQPTDRTSFTPDRSAGATRRV